MTEIQRIARKKRRHLSFSRELEGAVEELTPDYFQYSRWAERMLWEALIDEHGEDAVLAAVEKVQADMDDEDLLPESEREQYELPA